MRPPFVHDFPVLHADDVDVFVLALGGWRRRCLLTAHRRLATAPSLRQLLDLGVKLLVGLRGDERVSEDERRVLTVFAG
jgi:hypothetical protein